MAGAAKEPLAGEQLAFLRLRLTVYCSRAAEAFLADRKRFEEAAARAGSVGPADRKAWELTQEEKKAERRRLEKARRQGRPLGSHRQR